MEFVKIRNTYYNTALIGWASSREVEGETKYFVQFIGGREQEITEEEFNNIIS